MSRTKKALVIDQRFNGGGGIDQELSAFSSRRSTNTPADAMYGLDVPRPLETFCGPMIVMQNSGDPPRTRRCSPQGFKDLKLGRVLGVPTMGAVIATGSYRLADGSTIRTPGAGVWTAKGENLEKTGVKPDVSSTTLRKVHKGRDAG